MKSASLIPDGDPVRLGARFHVNAGGLPLNYEITEFVPNEKVVLDAKHFSNPSRPRHVELRQNQRARTCATPSSSLEPVTSSATARTSGWAFATATPWPAQDSMGRSLGMSPNAITSAA